MLLKGKTALITGCNRGIGKAILTSFAENGANVYANARTEGSLDKIAEDLNKKYDCNVVPVYFDVCDDEKVKKVFIKIKKEQTALDILVNNAGIMKDAVIGMISMENMKNTFDVNVFAVIKLIQLATKLMIPQKKGSIINLSSIVGIEGNKGQLVYSASKGAVATLTKTASKELCEKGIRVNAIAPGMIETDMFKSIGEEKVAEYVGKIGMKRLGETKDIAQTAVFLASDMSAYITGQIIGVNGGAVI